ncbi:MAG: M18 family aminopeptidase [Bacillota bacterium]|nr:M18 family aminopeptidase [Bacillota bacterium]
MTKNAFAKDLIQFIDKSPTAFHAVAEMVARLEKAGFQRLDETKPWKLKQGSGYFITRNDSAIIAFLLGERGAGYHIVGSHSDSPTFKIKPNPEMKIEKHYVTLNTEKYGGAILSTWLDRPLSVAGRLMLKSKDPMHPKTKLVRVDQDLLVIPNVAIHMNREVNDGFKFNPQVDTLPLMTMGIGDENPAEMLKQVVAKAAGVKPEDIVGQDLYLYDRAGGSIVGLNNEFISSGRLDNLAMAHVSIEALIDRFQSKKSKNKATAICIVNDNEEVGSGSKQGADSPFLQNLMRRLCHAEIDGTTPQQTGAEELYQIALAKSFIISADLAHAVHPNHPEHHDPTNRPLMGKGIVLKHSANMKYTTDADSAAVFKQLCDLAGEPYQEFVNRSDKLGGSTIGPITSSHIDIRGLDIGSPILSMHSVRELGSVDDHFGLFRILKEFYKQA